MEKRYKRIFNESINKSVEDKFYHALSDLYMEYVNELGGPDFKDFGKEVAEGIVENFRSATYGDYPEDDANDDLDKFMQGFNSVKKRV